jgi:hypothetical protein
MTLESFVSILVISAAATSIGIEIIKNLLDKAGITYKTMPLAVIVSFVVGVVEMVIYTSNAGFSYMTIVYALCMGVANVVGSNVGYDKVKDFIYTLFSKTE